MRDAAKEGVAVGFFDGVHLGHQAILREAKSAITFRNHPLSVLAPARTPRLVMSLEDRLSAIRACGVRKIVTLDFTEELAQESPEAFMKRLGHHVRCGENWRFGAGGAGDADFLRVRGVAVDIVPSAVYDGARISSTRIRAALEDGKVVDANAMLGRPFSVRGRVFRGKGVGMRLGCPTLNLSVKTDLRLPLGVYAVYACGERAVANYGVAPTMGDEAWADPCLEIHFANGFTGGVSAGAVCRVQLLEFIRPEQKFESLEELVRQIARDVARAGGGR